MDYPRPSMGRRLAGHLWTVAPNLGRRLWPGQVPAAEPWATLVNDPDLGPVRLTGELRRRSDTDTVLVIVHGLGGDPRRPYCINGARAAERAGLACLRLALRGADRLGEDFYHGGLVQDVEAALRSPEMAAYRDVLLLGYSMGGHTALMAAVRRIDPRLRAVAAICAPLDLRLGQQAIDAPRRWLYRRHVLRSLNEIYRAVARRRPVPTPVPRVEHARTIRERDRLTICPRFGFRDPDDYYARASVGPRLAGLELPALLVASSSDPMVPPGTLTAAIAGASSRLEVRWSTTGGHVYFPRRVDLGWPKPGEVEQQAVEWLLRQSRASAASSVR